MTWIARLTVIKNTKTHTLPAVKEPGRHRRGEVVSIREVDSLPTGEVFNHSTLAYFYVTDIPDTKTLQQLQDKVTRNHEHSTDVDASGEPVTLGRKRLFIPVSEIPLAKRQKLKNDGWASATWTQAATTFKRRLADVVPSGQGDPADDDVDDAAGTIEDITV